MPKPRAIPVTFYKWEGDACRLHKDKDGTMTADIYRGGRGLLAIDPTDLLFCASEINEDAYKQLVLDEMEYRKAKGER